MKFSKINKYLAKGFLTKFIEILLAFSLLIFFINLIDTLDKVRGSDVPFSAIALMSALQIPDFLGDIVSSLILISALATFFLLSTKSEITIIRNSGFSLWQMLKPIAISAFVLGIFWTIVLDPLSIIMIKKFNSLEGKYVKNESREYVAPQTGIWIKQVNTNNPDEEIIIQAKKVYSQNMELNDVNLWFFDKNGEFYKKIDAPKIILREKKWLVFDAIINDEQNLNKKIDKLQIPTSLEADFIMHKIVNNFQNVKFFSIYELPNLIMDLRASGFDSIKFIVYFNKLISQPFLFVAMILIACYFGINHIRNNNTVLMGFLGIVFGLILYITSSIINSLGSSGLISVFASTWLIVIICLAIGILLIYRKENI